VSSGGVEHELRHGPYTAVVTDIGAGLRVLRHEDLDLVRSYPAESVRPRYSGVILAPWPNRVTDGRYEFDGQSHQLPVNEPERGHALHGLTLWDRFTPAHSSDRGVTLSTDLVPRVGYPFPLTISVTYVLHDHGLTTTVLVRNTGSRPAPWGVAAHPYVCAGTGHVDECALTVPADEFLEVTGERMLPGDVRTVTEELDFRAARRIESTFIDHAYTGLRADADGLARVTLVADSGRGVECAWDPQLLPWVQVHTADAPEPENNRTALAVEPMTCAPDAFNSGAGLVTLAPGGEHTASWTLRAL
jgi:aldose 1-epimerase